MGMLQAPGAKNCILRLLLRYISWNGVFGSVSEYPEPPHIRDYNHGTDQYYQDLVPAPLADTPEGRVAVVTVGGLTYPADF